MPKKIMTKAEADQFVATVRALHTPDQDPSAQAPVQDRKAPQLVGTGEGLAAATRQRDLIAHELDRLKKQVAGMERAITAVEARMKC